MRRNLPRTHCLTHQLPEDQATPLGRMCRRCKQRIYADVPPGRLRAFWESQPAAYSVRGEPCFAFSLMWDDFRIRSLHPPGSHEDDRAEKAREYERFRIEQEAAAGDVDASIVPLAEDFAGFDDEDDADWWK